jgi:hypothetical protein
MRDPDSGSGLYLAQYPPEPLSEQIYLPASSQLVFILTVLIAAHVLVG